jgi:hypothetical protein
MHNEEFHDLCSTPTVIRVIKSRRPWNVTHVGGKEKCKKGLNLKETDHLDDLDINGRIMLK